MAPTHQTTPISLSTPAVDITQTFASPSSSTEGFFQPPPNVQSQFDDDNALQRALKFFLPDRVREELIPELSTFSRLVLAPKITRWIDYAEKNPPYVKHWDSWGKRRDVLVTSEGWRNLQALGIQEGIVAIPYDNERGVFSRVHQFAKYHLWAGNIEVTAVDGHPLGPWKIDGFKWFSSATDADMVVMLARTTKGISTFFAPMRKTVPASARDILGHETELNGISIQRLKSKLGTRALPTAELVLNGTRGYLIGEDGKGTKEITTVLNIARIHNGFTAIGLWGRGLSVVRAFGRARSVGQKPLLEKTAYVTTVAKMHVEYRANVLFNYFVAGLLGVVEQEQIKAYRSVVGGAPVAVGSVGRVPGLRDAQMAEHLLRLLTPVLKGVTAKTAIAGLAECMECLGGVGYLENDDQIFNIARLYRDANVLSIWEGTTDMMAHDVLRVVYGKTRVAVLSAMRDWVKAACASTRLAEQKKVVSEWWNRWETWLRDVEKGEAEMKARVVMERLADVVQGVLLIADAESDGDRNAVDVLDAWLSTRRAGMGLSGDEGSAGSWRVTSARNMRVVYTAESPVGGQAKL
ncbi:hypothetical protein B0A55_04328 [Friedmanniomyces simplex]|uniref:Acyl-CoA dehydrogenase/oxidase C-terminal domain-containing protein n=1 Tax=Friedmanniomyces simplex TaxID=329884 RepID=A0A4U0XJT3_9PEZI|nr:hypothetical protein B0A55_04328 [Friedmanniomyces simplex]